MDIFKCGDNFEPPFDIQDYPHIGTKGRNALAVTVENPKKLPMGKYFIKMDDLEVVKRMFGKDQHLLTATDLNPEDRQNFESVLKICDDKVIHFLKKNVIASEAPSNYLQILSDNINAFKDRNLSPIERIKRLWRSLFLVRIWRHFILESKMYTLKENFISSYFYICTELNQGENN